MPKTTTFHRLVIPIGHNRFVYIDYPDDMSPDDWETVLVWLESNKALLISAESRAECLSEALREVVSMIENGESDAARLRAKAALGELSIAIPRQIEAATEQADG